MAHHQSAKKRNRQTEVRTEKNKYYAKTMRNALKKLRSTTDKPAATELYPKVTSMLDKLVKRNIIHKNKAGNLKSKLYKHIEGLK
jgi:small subunit ribosomal protein S20